MLKRIPVHYYQLITESMELEQLGFGKFYIANENGNQYLVEVLA